MIIRTIGFIYIICSDKGGVHGVQSHAALETSACFLGNHSHHLHLVDQIFFALVNVGKTVYFGAGQMGVCRHQILVERVLRQFIGHGRRIHMRFCHGMVYDAVDLLAHVINYRL